MFKRLFILILSLNAFINLSAQEPLLHPKQVASFYELKYSTKSNRLFWFDNNTESASLRKTLIHLIDSCAQRKWIGGTYHLKLLKDADKKPATDSVTLKKFDFYYTDAAIALLTETWKGYKVQPWVEFDAVSPKYKDSDEQFILERFLEIENSNKFIQELRGLEPVSAEYKLLQTACNQFYFAGKLDSLRLCLISLNQWKWVHHFNLPSFILINLASSNLYYFEKGQLVLKMKTVVGKPKTPSPMFAAWCEKLILYPYWYVPSSIFYNEFLEKIQKNVSWIDQNNMQVVDGNGKVIDHHKLNWYSYTYGNFPYILRQSTGCDNSLGVLKFDIVTPFGVYLHDTNNKTAFLSGHRYYSHGCIRLEEPIALAQKVLPSGIDTTFLQSCFKEQKPVDKLLNQPIAVFSMYMPFFPASRTKLSFYKDVYKLLPASHKTK